MELKFEDLNTDQLKQAKSAALKMVAKGVDPNSWVHICEWPSNFPRAKDSIAGLSTPLSPDVDITQYLYQYYRLTAFLNADIPY
jgi:hypothetical protein